MLKGLMDHWVPTRENLTSFWKTDIGTARRDLEELHDQIAFNNFTFYTKWYTNGIKSNLPFLRNCAEAQNVITGNEWGNQLVEHLHRMDVSAGAMLQMLTYEDGLWEQDLSLGTWDVRAVAKTDGACQLADFTQDRTISRIQDLVREQVRCFPGMDYLFLEFEGLSETLLAETYTVWACKNGEPDRRQVQFTDDVLRHCRALGTEPDLLWSVQGSRMLREYLGQLLARIRETLAGIDFRGQVGVVHHLYGYESLIYPDILPDKNWWLLPWHYWTFEDTNQSSGQILAKKRLSKALLRRWKDAGHRVCHIGDVALGNGGLDSVQEFYDFCVAHDLDGYLGMGNPQVERGLRWQRVTDETVLKARRLYARLY